MADLIKLLREQWRPMLVTVVWPSVFFMVLQTGDLVASTAAFFGGLISIVLIFTLANRLNTLTERLRQLVRSPGQLSKQRRVGVILTLGLHSAKPDSVARRVMGTLKPEYVGFLGTPATDQERIVDQLVADFTLPRERYRCESMDPMAYDKLKEKASSLIDWMVHERGLDRRSVMVDVTGGTVPMSLAAFVAASDRKIDCQYIVSVYDPAKNQVIPGDHQPVRLSS